MKKTNFVKDSVISIAGVVICKIIGLLYVIPFYAMISSTGGALYSYAYSIYALFLSLSTSGIPTAMSKIISEYNALDYKKTKIRVYKIGLALIVSLGIVAFLLMMLLAEPIAYLLIGDMQGGNSIEDIALVIRIISTALLVVPLLSVTKGYFQGEKNFKAAATANIIEQIARVAFLLIGCYLCLNVFNYDEKFAICFAVFSATIGAIIAYLYLLTKKRKLKEDISNDHDNIKKEERLSTKYLLKQVILCAIPFIIIDTLKSAYSIIDALTVVRGMNMLGYSANVSEIALSTLTTWGAKLTMIVISIAVGLSISLIPNIAEDNVNNNNQRVNHKINLSIAALLFITLPMAIGISFLAKPVWILFYSYNEVGIDIFKFFIFCSVSFSIYSVIISIGQTLNHSKQVFITLFTAFILKLLLNIPLMILLHQLNLPAYHGTSLATIITELVSAIYLLLYLRKKHNLNFKELRKNTLKILVSCISMLVGLFGLSIIFKMNSNTKIGSLFYIAIYSFIGAIIYFIISYKSGLIKDILGEKINKFKKKK